MFADDVALYRVIKSTIDYSHLQRDINSISGCVKGKHLQFNANKCKVMLVTKKRDNSIQPPQLCLDGVPLTRVYSYKYLGITLTLAFARDLHESFGLLNNYYRDPL